MWPRRHSNTPNPVLHCMPPHRNRHQGVVINLYSPDKDRGVPAPGDNHRTMGGYIDSSDFSSMTVATCKQELPRASTPSTQATIPKMMMLRGISMYHIYYLPPDTTMPSSTTNFETSSLWPRSTRLVVLDTPPPGSLGWHQILLPQLTWCFGHFTLENKTALTYP